MKGKRKIEAVFFDAAGTLIHLPAGVGYHYRLVAERHGLDLDETALNAAFRAAWKQMPLRETIRRPRPDDDKGWWRELVWRVLKECGVDEGQWPGGNLALPGFDAYFEELYDHFAGPDVWQLYPDAKEVLSALRGKYRLGVISNFDKRLRVILDHLGVSGYFETIVISSEVGADKPDPHIFEQALRTMGVRPEQALHAGDDPERDWQAAAAAGMEVFRLNRPENSLLGLVEFLAGD